MADQLTTVSKRRMTGCAGTVTPSEMESIDQAIRIQLDL